MKPVLIVSGDFVKTGGMDRANYALASYLAEQGREVHLAAYRAGDDLLARPNVTLHRAPKPLGSYFVAQPFLDHTGRREARKIAARGGDVVVNGGNCQWGDVNWLHHLNVLDRPARVGSPLRRLKRTLNYRLAVTTDRTALRRARLTITTCERNKRDLVEWLALPPGRIAVVYLGTDPTLFYPASPDERTATRTALDLPLDRPVLAFVGALGEDRRKGFDTLFEAWKQLCRDTSWDADLVVVGRGGEEPAWQARAAESGLASRIRFLGFRRDLPALFRACDAHVLPSRYEGYSLSTQEALCCGLPAFVTDTAGIAERYPSALHPLLIPDPNDAPDLAARLLAWRADTPRFAPAVATLSAQLRAHTWDRMAEEFASLMADTPLSP
ncbi:MAG: glycosyltransferase family 4 protein [Isosphaeraceae bacterium]|nr:glycosyltransferase family 4 protein [Isosphaeraceae bacterium]